MGWSDLRWTLPWLLTGCLRAPPTTPDPVEVLADSASDPCAFTTWSTVGEPFVRTWCSACHGRQVYGANRSGAPVGIQFETEADVLSRADRFAARALSDTPTMPPVGHAPERDLEVVRLWLDCAL